jgi:hypothetical protein
MPAWLTLPYRPFGNRSRDFRDVAHLGGKISGHEIDTISQVFPSTGDSLHICLTAKFPFRADLARDTRHFRCK